MADLKNALSYEQQIERLKTVHNLIIEDVDEAFDILKSINYYRLSAYGIGLKKNGDSEEYKDGISLNVLYRLYSFDSSLKNHLAQTIEQIEIKLRTQISYCIALKYGSEGYIDNSNFIQKTVKDGTDIHANIINGFKTECQRQKNTPMVKHHIEKYEGHFPVWAAVELFSFGNLSSLYDIMKPDDRQSIADLYNTEADYLSSWILSLVEVRNICAHYSRLYNMPLKQTPFLYTEHKKYRHKINKVFPVILVIKRMLNGNKWWDDFFRKIRNTFQEYSDVVNLAFIGFPKDWEIVLSDTQFNLVKKENLQD